MALTAIICENCRHIGVVAGNALPCVLSCSSRGDRRLVRRGFTVKSSGIEDADVRGIPQIPAR
jgi:hypothetical protein